MELKISATEAARTFSDLLNRVRYRGETFVVERGGEPVCRISPVGPPACTGAALVGLLGTLPHPGDEYLEELEAITRHQPALPKSPWDR